MEKFNTGLVLSGGGTKGIAHAGVLRFLEEQNIKIDIIAGTSAGALVAALYGFGQTTEEILKFFQSVNFFHWKHFVINQPGIVSSDIFRTYLKPILGKAKIKDSKIPLLLTATDLCSGKLEVFDEETSVIDAIISSAAIPGIATPHTLGEKVYCDGGVVNNFPADLLSEKAERLIGIYLSPIIKINKHQVKSIRSVLTRALDIILDRSERYKFSYCKWMITLPELNDYSGFETKKVHFEEMFDIGYHAAKETRPKTFAI